MQLVLGAAAGAGGEVVQGGKEEDLCKLAKIAAISGRGHESESAVTTCSGRSGRVRQ